MLLPLRYILPKKQSTVKNKQKPLRQGFGPFLVMIYGEGNDIEVGARMYRVTVKLKYGGKCGLVTLYAPVANKIQTLHRGYDE